MIATHSPKMLNAAIKNEALSAKIKEVPKHLICSKNTDLKKELWAAPANAAEMKKWREISATQNKYEESLPDLTDGRLKQILLPMDDKCQKYVSTTPIASMGLISEVFNRMYEQSLPFLKWIIQPTPVALSNHREALLMQSGSVRLLRRGLIKPEEESSWTGDFVQLTARCENMNISSGMMAAGFPAITAIGGLAHSMERHINSSLKFAIGFKEINWKFSVPRYSVRNGREAKPNFSTEEMRANAEIVILFQTSKPEELQEALKTVNRVAGGSLFDVEIKFIKDGLAPEASYLVDASKEIIELGQPDTLQAALEIYGAGGHWVDGEWQQQSKNGYTLNHTGYAFLEQPKKRMNSRNGNLHAWSEPVFSLVMQSSMSNKCWWQRNACDYSVIWEALT